MCAHSRAKYCDEGFGPCIRNDESDMIFLSVPDNKLHQQILVYHIFKDPSDLTGFKAVNYNTNQNCISF